MKTHNSRRLNLFALLLASTMAWPLNSAQGGLLPSFLTQKLKSANNMMHLKAKFDTTPGDANAIAWSPDSQYVISTGVFSATANIFDIRTEKQVRVIQRQAGGSAILAISPDGRYIASDGGADKFNTDRQKNQVKTLVWDAKTGAPIHRLGGPFANPGGNGVKALAFSPDSRTLAVGYIGMNGYISDEINYLYLYDMNSGALIKSFGNVKTGFLMDSIAYSPDGKYLADGSSDGDIRIWDVGSGKLDKTIKVYAHDIRALAYHPHGEFIAVGTRGVSWKFDQALGRNVILKTNDPVQIWSTENGKLVKSIGNLSANPVAGTVYDLTYSSDGKYLAVSSEDKVIRIWDTATWQLFDSVTLEYIPMSVRFSPDGKYLATGVGYIVHVFELGKH